MLGELGPFTTSLVVVVEVEPITWISTVAVVFHLLDLNYTRSYIQAFYIIKSVIAFDY